MTLTATRDEETGFFSAMFSKPATPTPSKLVNDALAAFNEAHANLVSVEAQIEEQRAASILEIEAHTKKVVECNTQQSRISRIRERLAEFLA